MKRKISFVLILALLVAAGSKAEPIDRSKAMLQAKNFLQAKGINVSQNLGEVQGPRKSHGINQETPYYYVFNNGNDEGFVIVSGDDRTMPVLAYSDKGHFNPNAISEGLQGILDGYAGEIDELDLKGVSAEGIKDAARTKKPTTQPIAPLITAKWGQREPYSSKLPMMPGTSNHCYVGCTSVAMAQLVYYHRNRLPAKLPKTIPGYTNSTKVAGKYIVLPSIAAGTAFNWNNMFDVLDGTQTAAQKNNVALLSACCAISIRTDFTPTVSTASVGNLLPALTNYFGFKSSYSTYLKRYAYTYEKWKEMLINELKQSRPVYYCGNSNYNGVHAFIVDGYDGGELFHVNWGWDGQNEGYFALSVLDPNYLNGEDAYVTNTSYCNNQFAFFDVQPAYGYSNVSDNTNLNVLINSASGTSATVTYTNNTANAGAYIFGLGYYDNNGNIQIMRQATNVYVNMVKGGTTTVKYNVAATDFSTKKLAAGTYKLFPIAKLKTEDEWRQCDQVTNYYYIKAVYSGSSVSLSVASYQANITATSITFPGSCVKGAQQPAIVAVKNTGEDYYGYIYLFASTSSSKGSAKSAYQVYIPAGKTIKIKLYFTPNTAATWNVWASYNSSGTGVIGQTTVKIASGSYANALGVASISLENVKTGYTVNGRNLKGKVSVKNYANYSFSGRISAVLYYKSGSTLYQAWKNCDENITLGSGKTTDFSFNFENLNPGTAYAIVFKTDDGKYFSYNYLYRYFYVTDAVLLYTADGNMKAVSPAATITVDANTVAADFTGTTAVVKKVVPNSNPNTLYYFGANEGATGLTGKNVIMGEVADKIALTHGYRFFPPKSFTAKSITYTRNSKLGTKGNDGWQTLVIPFDATKVTCDGKEISWFKSDKDYGKNFWLKEFSYIEGRSTILFGYTQQIKANHPYLYAVPGTYWGKEYNLVGKNVVFSATNAKVQADPVVVTGSDVFNFRGTYNSETIKNIYLLNSTGTKFVASSSATVNPFECYFVAREKDMTDVTDLNIGSIDEEELDAIVNTKVVAKEEMVDVYNLSGVKVGRVKADGTKYDLDNLPKGIYIIRGKKIIR